MRVEFEICGVAAGVEEIRIDSEVSLRAEIDAAIRRAASRMQVDPSDVRLRIGDERHAISKLARCHPTCGREVRRG
jgi:hypothetical protein